MQPSLGVAALEQLGISKTDSVRIFPHVDELVQNNVKMLEVMREELSKKQSGTDGGDSNNNNNNNNDPDNTTKRPQMKTMHVLMNK